MSDPSSTRTEAKFKAYDAHISTSHKILDATYSASQLAVRTAVLINGGAAVSILAFIGGLVGKVDLAQLNNVASGLQGFAWGVVSATAAMLFGYFTNYCHFQESRSVRWDSLSSSEQPNERWWRIAGYVMHVLGVVAGIVSLGFLVAGMIDVRNAVKTLRPVQDALNPLLM
jgi:hypothetical protein